MKTAAHVGVIEPEALQSLMLEPNTNLLLVQVTSPEVFWQAHIRGAVLVTPADLVCGIPPATGKLPGKAQLEALFSRIGYTPDRQIVVYDDEGGGWAGRFAWTLDVIGHRSWQYLNGGLHAWPGALEQGDTGAVPSRASQVTLNLDSAPIAELEDVLQAINDDSQIIWDVRSAAEYAGTRQAAARCGHIPGAINFDWMGLKDAVNKQRIPENIEAELAHLGLADKAVITHCQTHHRSGLSYMLGRVFGYNIRAYHGSWSEWGNREDTPVETGARGE